MSWKSTKETQPTSVVVDSGHQTGLRTHSGGLSSSFPTADPQPSVLMGCHKGHQLGLPASPPVMSGGQLTSLDSVPQSIKLAWESLSLVDRGIKIYLEVTETSTGNKKEEMYQSGVFSLSLRQDTHCWHPETRHVWVSFWEQLFEMQHKAQLHQLVGLLGAVLEKDR